MYHIDDLNVLEIEDEDVLCCFARVGHNDGVK